jgi:hypothetical protein
VTSLGFAHYFGCDARAAWVRRQPSVVSGETPCVNAHTATGGVAIKAHYSTIVPLTYAEHEFLHHYGISSFTKKYGVTLDELRAAAIATEAAWVKVQAHFEAEFPESQEPVAP